MIHVDTNLLIASVDPSHKHAGLWRPLIASGGAFAASAVAWTEFRSYPISYDQLRALDRIILGGILPFERVQADLAGEMFQKTNARRKNRLDSMIAATAILAEAELATVTEADFKPFIPFGLKLHRL